jgi:flagellar hook-basal body complex protein FliE
MDPIGQLNGNSPSVTYSRKDDKIENKGFDDTLKSLISRVDSQLKEADQMTEDFAAGKNQNLHEVMIASEKAGISLKFLIQIRNKLLEAYQEIMRMSF